LKFVCLGSFQKFSL